jgi:hypothetical protein
MWRQIQKGSMRTSGCWLSRYISISFFSAALAAPSQAGAAEAPRTATNAVTPAVDRVSAPQWQAKSRTEHETVWQSVRYATNAATGRVRAVTNSYTEIGTGLNRRDPATGRWSPSDPSLAAPGDGNMTTNAFYLIAYDSENRVKRMEINPELVPNIEIVPEAKIVFTYDFLGRRVKKEVWEYSP